jgi:hypothetical protein
VEQFIVINLILLWIVVLFNLLVTFKLVRIIAADVWNQNSPRLRTGQKAPPFEIDGLTGEKIALTDFSGRSIAGLFQVFGCEPRVWRHRKHTQLKTGNIPSLKNLYLEYINH